MPPSEARRAATSLLLIQVVICAALAVPCPRFQPGIELQEPAHVYSSNGLLAIDLNYLTALNTDGNVEFCYETEAGIRSPVLHVYPGDHLRLTLVNQVTGINSTAWNGTMTGMNVTSTNVHFHGLTVSPGPGQDDVLTIVISSGTNYTYDVDIPSSHEPGLYWYHPHLHGISESAVLGGASGLIIVDGLETKQPVVAGLSERTLTFRDNLVPGNTTPGGDVPSWDLSLNFIPVAFNSSAVPANVTPTPSGFSPNLYPLVPTVTMRPGATEFWRVANAAADTIMQIGIMYDGVLQNLQVIATDGVSVPSLGGINQTTVFLPPASRVEFIVRGPGISVNSALLVTFNIDTGPDGDDDPTRPLAMLVANQSAALPALQMPVSAPAVNTPNLSLAQLLNAVPNQTRNLYFSEVLSDPSDPNSPTNFYITVDGQTPELFSLNSNASIVTTQGSVEDWYIQNQAGEVHEFHIHQVHFVALEVNGVAVEQNDMVYRDTMQVSYWNGTGAYPYIKVRLDFTSVDVGEFVYHCHILGHEDGGMMAKIQVLESNATAVGAPSSPGSGGVPAGSFGVPQSPNASGGVPSGSAGVPQSPNASLIVPWVVSGVLAAVLIVLIVVIIVRNRR